MLVPTLFLSTLLTGCGGEETSAPTPESKPFEVPATIDLAELNKEAEQVSLVPSPTVMQESLKKAGINEALDTQVQVRNFTFKESQVSASAVKTGVLLADALLTVRTAPPELLVQRMESVKAGMTAIKAGGDIAATIDGIIVDIKAVGAGPRDGIEQQIEELQQVLIPELKFEAGEQVVPLILAGGWLEGSNLVASAISKAGKPEAGNELLRQGPVCDYFLKYVDAAEKANANEVIVGQLRTTLNKLKEISAKPALAIEDVNEVKAQTDAVLSML